jgi:hypothetical protein
VAVQVAVFGICAATFASTTHFGKLWLATPILLAFAAAAFAAYTVVLNRIDRVAINRRESLIAELCRAQ